ncbi:hypothetical protein GQ607_013346 [Colletotrichum asianum]|uniref:Uncharacterized protein n=1 Tax=Colletotrichum asianum TaxID=702518 RepID=A0A8H3W1E7_9PEZI|nr:hypothetical protein GQ607_013346 [Colletotrichum asianum]
MSCETYAHANPNAQTTVESGCSAWTKELLSSLLALGCIIGSVVVLFIYRENPLPKWPKLISINTLLAVFTAIFKASLVFPIAEGLGQLKWNWFGRPHRLGDIVLVGLATFHGERTASVGQGVRSAYKDERKAVIDDRQVLSDAWSFHYRRSSRDRPILPSYNQSPDMPDRRRLRPGSSFATQQLYLHRSTAFRQRHSKRQ